MCLILSFPWLLRFLEGAVGRWNIAGPNIFSTPSVYPLPFFMLSFRVTYSVALLVCTRM